VKLAAMEGQFQTVAPAPLRIGGWPDEDARRTRYALEIPRMLSFLAHGDFDAEVRGLDEFPRDEWPPVAITHITFQIMVAIGTFSVAMAVVGLYLAWRHGPLADHRWYLKLLVAGAPLGFIAIEAGWTVTEVGRQPWIIHGIMRTSEAVTPMPNLIVPFTTFTLLYLVLAVVVWRLMRRHVFQSVECESA
jgi:cytochrome d ubiquinol oxidase subunit I